MHVKGIINGSIPLITCVSLASTQDTLMLSDLTEPEFVEDL